MGKGNFCLKDFSHFLAQHNIVSLGGKRIHKTRISYILANSFYYGHFIYAGELYEGKHEPIIAKKLFDQVQEVLKQRGKPQRTERIPKPFTGLFRCGECDMMITAEIQKGHTYYRCSKKGKPCTQKYIREEEINRQLSSLLQTVFLRSDWAEKMLNKLDTEQTETAQSMTAVVTEARQEISELKAKLQRLLDSYLDQDIEREVYLENKANLMSQKKTLEEKIVSLQQQQSVRLQPIPEWIKTASNLNEIAAAPDLIPKRDHALRIFRSNLSITDRFIKAQAVAPWRYLSDNDGSLSVVQLYNLARTYYIKNQ